MGYGALGLHVNNDVLTGEILVLHYHFKSRSKKTSLEFVQQMSQLYLLRHFRILMRNVNTKLNLSNEMLTVPEVNQQISSGPFESILDSDNLESST